jgi:nicotinamidase-related amidase
MRNHSYGVNASMTARAAHDRGYEIIFAENAMITLTEEAHSVAVKNIFPGMGRVRTTDEVLKVPVR